MTPSLDNKVILLDYIKKGLTLEITSESKCAMYEIDEANADRNGEASLQILEGRSYDYE